MVARMTASISLGSIPLAEMASFEASVAMSMSDWSSAARTLVITPVRCRIHSSDESIGPAISSLVTTSEPREAPRP